ncbi:MAG: hypothetical protein IJ690_04325 [Clostridia bacterium]|nr:hypothetical protein [Clostridia bacterium]
MIQVSSRFLDNDCTDKYAVVINTDDARNDELFEKQQDKTEHEQDFIMKLARAYKPMSIKVVTFYKCHLRYCSNRIVFATADEKDSFMEDLLSSGKVKLAKELPKGKILTRKDLN